MYASQKIPKRIQHKRWCRNGHHPDAFSIRQAAAAVNHLVAYRRRVFLNACAPLDTMLPGVGPTVVWRAAMKTGLAVSQIRFDVIMGVDITAGGAGSMPNTHVEIDVTESGGATVTKRIDYGSSASETEDKPYLLAERQLRFDVDPETVYEIAIESHDGARPLSVCGYEYAEPDIDVARPPYVELAPTVYQPITDEIRQAVLGGASDLWLSNGIHLLCWPGLGSGTARTVASATFTNVQDGSSTTTSAATPGYYFGAEGAGDGALTDLVPWVRLKDGDDLPITFAVYADASSAAATGEVALLDSAGNGPSIGSIDSSGPKWWYADTTFSNVSAIAGSGKVDLKARNTTGGQSIAVYAIAIWTRAA